MWIGNTPSFCDECGRTTIEEFVEHFLLDFQGNWQRRLICIKCNGDKPTEMRTRYRYNQQKGGWLPVAS